MAFLRIQSFIGQNSCKDKIFNKMKICQFYRILKDNFCCLNPALNTVDCLKIGLYYMTCESGRFNEINFY